MGHGESRHLPIFSQLLAGGATTVPALIVCLQRFLLQTYIFNYVGVWREFEDTHRPATNLSAQPCDGFPKTFERDDAHWSENACSVVVRSEDSTIRVAPGQGQRVFQTKGV